jgi:WD40 repeat protein
VSNGTVYAGVDWDLVQVTTDEIVAVTDQNSSPFTRAVPLAGGVLATGAISMAIDPVGNISTRQFIDGTDFVATNGSDLLVTAAGHRVRLWATDSVLLATADNTFRQPVWQADVPADVTSLALTADNQVIAGLADGTTVLGTDLSRCYGGDGTPVTAVAALPDGSVITGTASGVIRRWPADPAHGPTVLAHRAGAIAALAVTDTWLLSAGADGTLLLWAVDQFHLVHETTIGTPIVAMAAEDDLVAARGEDGRLWLLDLDPMPDRITPTPLSISPSAISFDGRLRVAVDSGRHELTGIRVWVDGVPVPMTCADPWPAVRPDGSLLVPVRLTAERPIYFESPEPLHHGQVDLDLAAPAAIGEPAIVLHTR